MGIVVMSRAFLAAVVLIAWCPTFIAAQDASVATPAAPAATLPKDAADFHLFLLVGQSNMAGRGKVEDQDREVHPRIVMLNKAGEWVPATDPLHFDKPGIVGVGLGKTFALDYAKANPDATIGLIPSAVGGSPIAAWEPGGYHPSTKTHPWDDMLPRARQALQVGTLKGILWHQGESDSKAELADVYAEKLHALVTRFRTELSATNVPFVVGQMGQFDERPWNEHRKKVDQVHRSLPQNVPNTAFAGSDGLNHKGDEVHFDAASYRKLGHRYFAAFQSLVHKLPASDRVP